MGYLACVGSVVILIWSAFSVRAAELTRTFNLDPIPEAKQKAAGTGPDSTTDDFLAAAGLGFDAADAPKVFYNARTGALHVTAKEEDMAVIEAAVRSKVRAQEPQVSIRVIVAEFETSKEPEVQALLDPSQPLRPIPPLKLSATGELCPAPAPTLFGVLTESQAKGVLEFLQDLPNADILTAPVRTTTSGQQVRIAFEDHGIITGAPFHAPDEKVKEDTLAD